MLSMYSAILHDNPVITHPHLIPRFHLTLEMLEDRSPMSVNTVESKRILLTFSFSLLQPFIFRGVSCPVHQAGYYRQSRSTHQLDDIPTLLNSRTKKNDQLTMLLLVFLKKPLPDVLPPAVCRKKGEGLNIMMFQRAL